MLPESLMKLAAEAGAAIVEAAVTPAWPATKTRFAELFALGDEHRYAVMARRLEDTRTRLDGVSTRELAALRRRETQSWATRVEDLLDDHLEVAEELRRLLAAAIWY